MTTEKACTGCGETKPITEYHRNARYKDGHAARCKVCVLAQQAEYRARGANRDRSQVPTTKGCTTCEVEKPLTDFYAKASTPDGRYAQCRECMSAHNQRYRAENRAELLARSKTRYRAKKDWYRSYKREYHARRWATDPEYRARMTANNTRYYRLLADAKQEPYTRQEIFERDGWVCGICDQPIDPQVRWPDPACATVDHVVPLSRGDDTPANVQASHGSCNFGKCDRVDHEDREVAA